VTDIFDNHPEEEQAPEQTSIFDSHPQEDDARPYAAPGSMEDKQRRIQDTVAELRAKNMDTIRAQKAFSLSREEGLPMDVAYRQADQFVKSRKQARLLLLRAGWRRQLPATFQKVTTLSLYTEEDVKKLGTWEKLSLQWQKTGGNRRRASSFPTSATRCAPARPRNRTRRLLRDQAAAGVTV
jgi:hypothetical protein